jgi:hypothetical protein
MDGFGFVGLVDIALLAIAALVLLMGGTSRERNTALAVGAGGGLVAVQIAGVHLFTILVVLWSVARVGRSKPRRLDPLATLVGSAALVGVTVFFGDLVNSPTLALQLLALALSAALVGGLGDRRSVAWMMQGLLAVVSLGSLVALLQVANVIPTDLWHTDVSSVGRPTGIYPEPDWLGMLSGIGLVVSWAIPLPTRLRTVLIFVNGCSWILAFARAAWIGVLVAALAGGAVAAVRAAQRGEGLRSKELRGEAGLWRGRLNGVLLLFVAGVLLSAANPAFRTDVVSRVGTLFGTGDDDISGQARILQLQGLKSLVATAPWYGHGISAAGRVGVSGLIEYGQTDNNVGSNWLVSMWVDAKLLAAPLILCIVALVLRSVGRIAGPALAVVVVSSLFSNAMYMPIAWLLIGLCLVERDDGGSLDVGWRPRSRTTRRTRRAFVHGPSVLRR